MIGLTPLYGNWSKGTRRKGLTLKAQGVLQIGRSGGLDLASSLEAKFGARSGQVHQLRGKTWGVLSPQDAKVGKMSQFWGHI